MPIELIIKKSLNNDDQKLILFQNSSKRILKLMNLTHNLPKQKENLEIFLSKRKIYRKKKNKRVKKGTTVGERKHELKIIVTDYGERNDSEIKI